MARRRDASLAALIKLNAVVLGVLAIVVAWRGTLLAIVMAVAAIAVWKGGDLVARRAATGPAAGAAEGDEPPPT